MNGWKLQMSSVFLVLIALMLAVPTSKAKRGCASFGHSCFGGHGKRAPLPADSGTLNPPPFDPIELHAMHIFRQLCTLQPEQYVRLAPLFTKLAENYIVESEEPLPRYYLELLHRMRRSKASLKKRKFGRRSNSGH